MNCKNVFVDVSGIKLINLWRVNSLLPATSKIAKERLEIVAEEKVCWNGFMCYGLYDILSI